MTTSTFLQTTAHQPQIIWRVWDDRSCNTPEQRFVRDRELGLAVANGAPPTYRLWTSPPSLAVSRQDTRLPAFAEASSKMTIAGWPVVVRDTGGSAIALGPGVLLISMVISRASFVGMPGMAMELVYRMLCAPIQQALSRLGIQTLFGSVPGAFCDGRFNLVVDGKKIAGTAQAWRATGSPASVSGGGYLLAQAALLVDVKREAMTEVINRFYYLAGKPAQFDAANIHSVRDCLSTGGEKSSQASAPALVDRVRHKIIEHVQDAGNESCKPTNLNNLEQTCW